MSNILQMINKLCPDGVDYIELGELGKFENIGVDKKIIAGQKEILLLNYMDIYKNKYIDEKVLTMKVTASDKKIEQCSVEKGDIFLTPTSEKKDEIGRASVILNTIKNSCYSYHIMRFRLFDLNILTSKYIRYNFETLFVQKQIMKYSQGLTRFGLKKDKFSKLKIPFPPLEIQQQIVIILDKFTKTTEKLKINLDKELKLRKNQYEYYRNKLFTFSDDVEMVKMEQICELKTGGTPKTEILQYWNNGNIPWMSSGEVNKCIITSTEKFITKSGYNNSNTKMLPKNTVVIALAGQGKTRGKVAITKIELCTNQSLCGIIPNNILNNKFLYYFLKSQYQNLRKISIGNGTRGALNLKILKDYLIPLPPLETQQKIVNILDRFDIIYNDITKCLLQEIETRQKQYEYYRDKLLNFKEKQK